MDSGVLSRILDDIREYGGDYVIDQFDIGHESRDSSSARITVEARDDEALQRLLMRLQTRGVNQLDPGAAKTGVAERDGVLPDGFYSTTNLETRVRIDDGWYDVENPELDCGLVIDRTSEKPRARTVAVSEIVAGMHVVLGASGTRVTLPAPDPRDVSFGLLESHAPTQEPAILLRQVADAMRRTREKKQKLLWVGGTDVVHTGATPAMVALIMAGFVDVLFAGNALAAHDIGSSLHGASPGPDRFLGQEVEQGQEHHIRAVNTIRKAGSIAAAVENGVLSSGIMHALVTQQKRFVLVGSVRDGGPLPDVYTDVVEGQRAMRAEIEGVGLCVMASTLLHSIATGNILPASVPLVCVDRNAATVTRITDRGWSQACGIVTDVGLFLEQLALELIPDYRLN